MSMNASGLILAILLAVILYFVGIVILSKNKFWAFILPGVAAIITFYNWIKPIIIPNPYLTMKECINMELFGFLTVLGMILDVFLKIKRKNL